MLNTSKDIEFSHQFTFSYMKDNNNIGILGSKVLMD